MSAVLVPHHVEQDEDGVWCAEAIISERVGATAYGETRDQALADLRQAVIVSFEADGVVPPHLARVDADFESHDEDGAEYASKFRV